MPTFWEGVGLTFDDVLLVPRFSTLRSRSEASTTTRLTRKLTISIPVVSAAMDTVTESRMAIAMAREGGLGVIHRFMPVSQQVSEILKVKRAEGIVIDDPYTIGLGSTVADARREMEARNVSGLIVVDSEKRVHGIVTARDIMFERDETMVEEVMTPRSRLVTAEEGIRIEDAVKLIKKHKVEKIPIVDKEWRVKGLITAKDIRSRGLYPHSSRDSKGRMMVGAAIGVKGDYLERARALIEAETDVIVVDVAHGHTELVLNALKTLRREYGEDLQIIAGNVATPEGFEDLAAYSDCVKVGIGPGAVCTTRIVAGVGVPQLTAILGCAEASERSGVPMMADGGVRSSADVVKALAAGASTVMIGMLLAGTDESPGAVVVRNGRKSKVYRGMASFYAMLGRETKSTGDIPLDEIADYSYMSEGVEAYVDYKGSASDVIKQLVSGLRSGMSYLGARTIDELRRNATFIQITHAAYIESLPHDVERIS
ncbi:MAG: IMP dehydrogenase [Nitrososphaerota archaeon]|nr:IMP dehydrogenase [Candidatus Calditenuaceae archaeon]MDW8072775.1 IMP dehydrogenase [Nitrososphaerota archaeon]